jgi:hypothetical protein
MIKTIEKNKYYVYIHKIPNTNTIIYIGSGTLSRVYECNGLKTNNSRPKEWIKIFNKYGKIDVEIIFETYVKKDAFIMETIIGKQLYKLKEPLCNIRVGNTCLNKKDHPMFNKTKIINLYLMKKHNLYCCKTIKDAIDFLKCTETSLWRLRNGMRKSLYGYTIASDDEIF